MRTIGDTSKSSTVNSHQYSKDFQLGSITQFTMNSQTEALDLSKGMIKAQTVCEEASKDDLVSESQKSKCGETEDEPARKRRRLTENVPHSNVIQWLAKNTFDQSPPGLSHTVDIFEGQKQRATNSSPTEASSPPLTLSQAVLPQMAQTEFPLPTVGRTIQGVTVRLLERHLWNAFNNTGTEMIINKSGRRMFPYVTMEVEGLEPNELYSFYLEIYQVDDNCYKYVNKQWTPVGAAESMATNPPVIHTDSPKPGSFWMKNSINFASVKITNTSERSAYKIFLRSMHKYMTRIHIVKGSPGVQDVSRCPTYIFSLPETSFIAVTAYKNKAVTYMKIMNNPFAKPYRESSNEAPPRARCLRKLFTAKQAEDKKEVLEAKRSTSPAQPFIPTKALVQPPMQCTPMWYPHPGMHFPSAPTTPYFFPHAPMMTPYSSPYFRPFETNQMPHPVRLTL